MYVRKILVIIIQDLLKYGYLKSTMQGFVPYLALYLQISLKVCQWKSFCTENDINQCPPSNISPGFLKKNRIGGEIRLYIRHVDEQMIWPGAVQRCQDMTGVQFIYKLKSSLLQLIYALCMLVPCTETFHTYYLVTVWNNCGENDTLT